jgi:hypothetical protein
MGDSGSREHWNARVEVGMMWTGGGVTLCRNRPDVVARIVSIRPVEVVGAMRVVAIHVRTSRRMRPDATFADYDPLVHLVNGPGPAPPNALPPAGYVVPTACRTLKVGEIMTTVEKTGPEGGYLRGLEVTYRWDGRLHRFVIPWTFGLCGTGEGEGGALIRERCSNIWPWPPSPRPSPR